MDCCGHGHCHALTRRRWMWGTVLSSVGAILGGSVRPRGSTAAAQTAERYTKKVALVLQGDRSKAATSCGKTPKSLA
jgi:hypothetical protein